MGVERAHERRAVERIIANLGMGADAPTVHATDAEPLLAGYRSMFEAGRATGAFRSTLDSDVMAVTYAAAIEAMHRHFDAHPDADVEAYADALVDILLAACGAS